MTTNYSVGDLVTVNLTKLTQWAAMIGHQRVEWAITQSFLEIRGATPTQWCYFKGHKAIFCLPAAVLDPAFTG